MGKKRLFCFSHGWGARGSEKLGWQGSGEVLRGVERPGCSLTMKSSLTNQSCWSGIPAWPVYPRRGRGEWAGNWGVGRGQKAKNEAGDSLQQNSEMLRIIFIPSLPLLPGVQLLVFPCFVSQLLIVKKRNLWSRLWHSLLHSTVDVCQALTVCVYVSLEKQVS
jgi:hypothetical protein